MSQNNPFAKLGALDQMLYQETAPKPKDPEVDKVNDVEPRKPATIDASLLANQQTSTPERKQTDKKANQQTNKLENQQTSTPPLCTKEKKKYGTYLREDSILAIQVHAIQTKRNDHEVLQDAVDFYFKNIKN